MVRQDLHYFVQRFIIPLGSIAGNIQVCNMLPMNHLRVWPASVVCLCVFVVGLHRVGWILSWIVSCRVELG
jgi:hypothetical protein